MFCLYTTSWIENINTLQYKWKLNKLLTRFSEQFSWLNWIFDSWIVKLYFYNVSFFSQYLQMICNNRKKRKESQKFQVFEPIIATTIAATKLIMHLQLVVRPPSPQITCKYDILTFKKRSKQHFSPPRRERKKYFISFAKQMC